MFNLSNPIPLKMFARSHAHGIVRCQLHSAQMRFYYVLHHCLICIIPLAPWLRKQPVQINNTISRCNSILVNSPHYVYIFQFMTIIAIAPFRRKRVSMKGILPELLPSNYISMFMYGMSFYFVLCDISPDL